jgi:hypothetical protein
MQMKFKITSVLELIVPLSIAVMLSAFLGCGGGGSYGASTAYDGTWSVNLKGYTYPAKNSASDVTCTERFTTIDIAHGFGSTTQIEDCLNTDYPVGGTAISVTISPAMSGVAVSGVEGTVDAIITGGAHITGTCISRVACAAGSANSGGDLTLIKCGQAGTGC